MPARIGPVGIGLPISGGGGGGGGSSTLLAVVHGSSEIGTPFSGPTDISTHPWRQVAFTGDVALTPPACGAGPPGRMGAGIWVRDIVTGEANPVLQFVPGGANGYLGGWVYQIDGVLGGADSISLAFNNIAPIANGALVNLHATVSAQSMFLTTTTWCKVSYDAGWCAGGLAATKILSTASGTEVINKSSNNDCGEDGCPWVWLAYATGTGLLATAVQTLAGGYGSGAYTCGWNTGQVGVVIPMGSDFAFATKTGFNSSGIVGNQITVSIA